MADTPEPLPTGRRPEIDAAIRTVANHRRRALLQLLDRDGADAVTPGEIIDHIVARSRAEIDRRQLRIILQHHELPMLDAQNVIDYDAADGVITRGPAWDTVGPLLNAVRVVVDDD